MSFSKRLNNELKVLAAASLYFGCWFAGLLAIKSIVLAEYNIAFQHYSMALVGALILAKVVLILELVPLGSWVKAQLAWVDVLLRTGLYSLGVLVVLVFEKGLEGRHEFGGFTAAVEEALHGANSDHVWANAICVSGALLGYNIISVIRGNLGEGAIFRMLITPIPDTAPRHEGSVPRI